MEINSYSKGLVKLINKVNASKTSQICNLLWKAYKNKKTVFFAGNGGSASTATHIAADIGKNTSYKNKPRFRTVALTDNVAWSTAIANDISYGDIFVEQLKNLAKPEDILFVFSVSGSSPNLVKAVAWANKNKLITLGLLGKDGGKLKSKLSKSIIVKSNDYGLVESVHSYIHHFLVQELANRIKLL